jgi:hypothetical protein
MVFILFANVAEIRKNKAWAEIVQRLILIIFNYKERRQHYA